MDKYVTALLAGNIAASTSLQEAKAPEWVMLIPAGRIDTNDGRFFNNDNPDGVIAAFAANKLDLPFDFEHGSETVATRGEFAPALAGSRNLPIVKVPFSDALNGPHGDVLQSKQRK